MDRPLRVADLAPRKNATFAALMLAGLLAVGGLEALYAWMPRLAPMTTDGRVAALDLEGEGSLAVWFSTATLEMAALASLLVYVIRRQTPGAGRARIWLCAAAAWLAMSIDECASLHEAFKELMSHATGERILGDGTIWWAGGYAIVLSLLGLGMLRAVWPCRSAIAALFSTAAFYGAAVAAEMALLLPRKNAPEVMVEEGCEMVGNLCLLLSMGLSARHAVRAYESTAAKKAGAVERERVAAFQRAA
ncbi:MAG TPA: hypothetical protein VGN42_15430 [Pirellulales bacterium]|jgi:hypothetical protein|nr:hypothetical protein [Pirellulales bacterium]